MAGNRRDVGLHWGICPSEWIAVRKTRSGYIETDTKKGGWAQREEIETGYTENRWE